jgi:hypothetical protein
MESHHPRLSDCSKLQLNPIACKALSETALTHPHKFKYFKPLQYPVKYTSAESEKFEQPLILSLVSNPQPSAKANRDLSLSLKLLERSRSLRSWQLFATASTALSSS